MSSLSQRFHNHLCFSSHAKLRFTTQRWGIMQFASLGDLHDGLFAQNVFDALGKRFAHIAAVTQQHLHLAQGKFAALQRLQGPFEVGSFFLPLRGDCGQVLSVCFFGQGRTMRANAL